MVRCYRIGSSADRKLCSDSWILRRVISSTASSSAAEPYGLTSTSPERVSFGSSWKMWIPTTRRRSLPDGRMRNSLARPALCRCKSSRRSSRQQHRTDAQRRKGHRCFRQNVFSDDVEYRGQGLHAFSGAGGHRRAKPEKRHRTRCPFLCVHRKTEPGSTDPYRRIAGLSAAQEELDFRRTGRQTLSPSARQKAHAEERSTVEQLLGGPKPSASGVEDLLWALLMSPEFQYIH